AFRYTTATASNDFPASPDVQIHKRFNVVFQFCEDSEIPEPSRTANSPDVVDDKVERLNRCGEKGPLEAWHYKFIVLEKVDGPDGKDLDWHNNIKHGVQTPEGRIADYKWSLHLSDWYQLTTESQSLVLVSRSILNELGVHENELPEVTNKEDLEEFEGLKKVPMRIEDLHYTHHDCYWPSSAGNAHVVPKLDPTLDEDGQLRPDALIVHDPDNLTGLARSPVKIKIAGSVESGGKPDRFKIKYVRLDDSRKDIPWVPLSPKRLSYIANLHLSEGRKIGSGNHSHVWQAYFDLPYITAHGLFYQCCEPRSSSPELKAPPFAEGIGQMSLHRRRDVFQTSDLIASSPEDRPNGIPTRFSVAAKIAEPYELCHLANEGEMYKEFPHYLKCEWSGYQQVRPVHVPQPCCAVVPKSYGFWVPEVVNSKLSNGVNVKSRSDVSRLNPILMMEECGSHVVVKELTLDQRYAQVYNRTDDLSAFSKGGVDGDFRRLCLSMFERILVAGFTQGSVYERNILVQPGPMRIAPELRTMENPSFRIIDFGRGVRRNKDMGEFRKARERDWKAIKKLLGFDNISPLYY
ncbi:hypothetical protein FRB97_007004, partial [Tulasnella sp. 331]